MGFFRHRCGLSFAEKLELTTGIQAENDSRMNYSPRRLAPNDTIGEARNTAQKVTIIISL